MRQAFRHRVSERRSISYAVFCLKKKMWGSQTDARRVAHRVREIVEQLMEVLAERIDRLAFQAQPRIAEHDDGSDGHRGEVYGRPAEDRMSLAVSSLSRLDEPAQIPGVR